MSDAAAARMRTYCSEERVYEKLQGFIEQIVPRPQPISEPVAVRELAAAAAAGPSQDWAGQAVFASEALDFTEAKLAG